MAQAADLITSKVLMGQSRDRGAFGLFRDGIKVLCCSHILHMLMLMHTNTTPHHFLPTWGLSE